MFTWSPYNRRTNSFDGAVGIPVHSGFTLFFKCVSGPHSKKRFPLDFASRGTFLIGKSEDAEVSLHRDDYVSERNALLRQGSIPEAIEIKDAGSTNGTKVDGQKIGGKGWTQMLVGSVVTVGKTSLQLVAE
jgi:pSer/pThr/pTyr-binding forkhead associated (FHA) protein